jgi:hypothetical protein
MHPRHLLQNNMDPQDTQKIPKNNIERNLRTYCRSIQSQPHILWTFVLQRNPQSQSRYLGDYCTTRRDLVPKRYQSDERGEIVLQENTIKEIKETWYCTSFRFTSELLKVVIYFCTLLNKASRAVVLHAVVCFLSG